MIRDLETRTGLTIHRVEIGRIDYLRDSARLFIFYFEKDWRTVGSGYQSNDNDD
ncbi:MAG: hypothetical protein U9R49_07190 [Bacteroidota bacterium]|nr:hypothetical protein [Bacteroidota bacterium]